MATALCIYLVLLFMSSYPEETSQGTSSASVAILLFKGS